MTLNDLLEWDSTFFGFKIGRIKADVKGLNGKYLQQAIQEAYRNGVKCLYLEIPFNNPEVVTYCSENKFILVDFKTTLVKKIEGNLYNFPANISEEKDEAFHPFLEKIVAHISKQSRYFQDPKFGEAESLRLYREWLRRSFYENFCKAFFCYIQDGRAAGFITIRERDGLPFIDLFGVADEYQEMGIGDCLITAAEDRVFRIGYQEIRVVTQGHNLAALRAYQRRMFRIIDMKIFYHKWLVGE